MKSAHEIALDAAIDRYLESQHLDGPTSFDPQPFREAIKAYLESLLGDAMMRDKIAEAIANAGDTPWIYEGEINTRQHQLFQDAVRDEAKAAIKSILEMTR